MASLWYSLIHSKWDVLRRRVLKQESVIGHQHEALNSRLRKKRDGRLEERERLFERAEMQTVLTSLVDLETPHDDELRSLLQMFLELREAHVLEGFELEVFGGLRCA